MLRWCSGVGVADWLGMIALWVAVIGLAIWAVLRLFPVQPGSHARDALDQRLAQGDIDLEAYRAARAAIDLSDPRVPPSGRQRGA